MVYGNNQIKQAVADKHIICYPYNSQNVSYASLDVTLGHYYYRVEQSNDHSVYNPFDANDVGRYFAGPYKAISHQAWCDMNGHKLLAGIAAEHLVIALKPGERILAHTHEFLGITPPGACELKSRSSWGRNGIAVCFDAGWVDPGYINRLTLEIYNLNSREIVLLPVGERIAQAIFHDTGPIDGSYGNDKAANYSGKYQQGNHLPTIIATWSPDQMLPKAYKDKRSLPQKILGASYD